MAAALFNRHARVAPHVHPEVVEVMREIGIDVETAEPQLLTRELAADTVRVITMGRADECPVVNAPMEDWCLPDPTGQPLEAVRERFAMTSTAVSVHWCQIWKSELSGVLYGDRLHYLGD